jgi:hypothetical protein
VMDQCMSCRFIEEDAVVGLPVDQGLPFRLPGETLT